MGVILEKFDFIKEIQQQRNLFDECFPENMGTPVREVRHYEWKFRSKPTSMRQNSYEYVAKEEEDMIGYYAAIPYEYICNGKSTQAAMVCDVMTGVKARGKGLFTKMGVYATEQYKAEGFDFATGYPIRPEVIPGHKKAGWSFPFEIPMYGRFIRLDSFLRNRNKGFLVPFGNVALKVFNGLMQLPSLTPKRIDIESYTENQLKEIKGFTVFLSKHVSENVVSLNKTVEFLEWRLNAPEKDYTILVARNNSNDIVGYTVFRNVEKEGVPCIGVLDFCFLDNYSDQAKFLLREISGIAVRNKAELILMMMIKHKAGKYCVSNAGFIKTPYKFSFIVKKMNEKISDDLIFNDKHWSLMWIDSDDL